MMDPLCQKVSESDLETDENTLLLNQSDVAFTRDVNFRFYWFRWYILFQFSLLCFVQTACATTWSPISLSAAKVFNFTKKDYDLLANWGVAGLMVFLPLDIWLLKKYGLRYAVLFGATSMFIGCGLRCVPSTLYKKYLIHVGQFFNGIAGCPVMSCAPFLSNAWFPLKDRVLATGIMLMTGSMGSLISNLLGPFLVEQPNNVTGSNLTDNTEKIRHEISVYLYLEFGLATIIFLMMITYFPSKPPSPPSMSAASQRFNILAGFKVLLRNKSYWSIAAIYVTLISGYYACMGVAPVYFEDKGVSQKTAGLMSTVANAVGFAMGVLFGWLADRLRTGRSYLWVFCVLFSFLSCLYIVVISLEWIPVSSFMFSTETLWVAMVMLGAIMNAIQPLAMEMWSDVAYPIDEGTATSIPVWISMMLMVIFFSTFTKFKDQKVSFYIMLGMSAASLPFLYYSVKKQATRLHVDLDSS